MFKKGIYCYWFEEKALKAVTKSACSNKQVKLNNIFNINYYTQKDCLKHEIVC